MLNPNKNLFPYSIVCEDLENRESFHNAIDRIEKIEGIVNLYFNSNQNFDIEIKFKSKNLIQKNIIEKILNEEGIKIKSFELIRKNYS